MCSSRSCWPSMESSVASQTRVAVSIVATPISNSPSERHDERIPPYATSSSPAGGCGEGDNGSWLTGRRDHPRQAATAEPAASTGASKWPSPSDRLSLAASSPRLLERPPLKPPEAPEELLELPPEAPLELPEDPELPEEPELPPPLQMLLAPQARPVSHVWPPQHDSPSLPQGTQVSLSLQTRSPSQMPGASSPPPLGQQGAPSPPQATQILPAPHSRSPSQVKPWQQFSPLPPQGKQKLRPEGGSVGAQTNSASQVAAMPQHGWSSAPQAMHVSSPRQLQTRPGASSHEPVLFGSGQQG